MKIAIIGYGRFGALFADILKPFGEIFVLTDKEVEPGIIKIEISQLVGMDLVIPAVPISAFKETLENIKPYLKSGVILMDVCSVKVMPCQWLVEIAPLDAQLIGSHPMFGPDSAKNSLENLQMVFTPLRTETKVYEDTKNIFVALKLKIIEMTAEEHDRQAANCLSLVHFIGRGLGRTEIQKKDITTVGFERLMAVNETVNNDTWQLFFDMQKYNPFAEAARARLISELVKLDQEIRTKKLE